MKHSYRKQVILTAIFLIVICLLIMLLMITINGKKKTNGILKNTLTDENDTLLLTGVLPMSDYAVKNKDLSTFDEGVVDYVNFKVTSDNYDGEYTIFVKDCNDYSDKDKIIEDQFIKVLLTDEENNLITSSKNGSVDSFANLKVYKDKPDKRIVYVDSIKANTEKSYILKTWVSDSTIPNKDKKYCLKVSVE